MVGHALAPGEQREAVQHVEDPAQGGEPGIGDGDDADLDPLRPRPAQVPLLTDPDRFGPVSHSFAGVGNRDGARGSCHQDKELEQWHSTGRRSIRRRSTRSSARPSSELAAGYGGVMIDIGHKLGLYKRDGGRRAR